MIALSLVIAYPCLSRVFLPATTFEGCPTSAARFGLECLQNLVDVLPALQGGMDASQWEKVSVHMDITTRCVPLHWIQPLDESASSHGVHHCSASDRFSVPIRRSFIAKICGHCT